MQLQGRVAVVTGAASGIGRGLAHTFAGRGCDLALADRDEAGVHALADSLRADGHRVSAHVVDVAQPEQIVRFVDEVVAAHGRAHVLVNNAGVSVTGLFEQTAMDEFEWLMAINFWGVVHGCRAFLPVLKEQDRAWLVNISSIFGIIGVPSQTAYCASKFGVRGFTESLDIELRSTSVGVSCVHPGAVATNIARASHFFGTLRPGQSKEQAGKLIERGQAPEAAARVIVRGIEREKRRILVGRDADMLDRLARWAPVRYRTLVRRFCR